MEPVNLANLDLITLLQAGGTPTLGIVGYLLWKLSKQVTELKTSVDTLVETMFRLIPHLNGENDETRSNRMPSRSLRVFTGQPKGGPSGSEGG